MEVPLSEADAAYQILGGMPDFSQERWFGIAPLKEVMPNHQLSNNTIDARPLPAPKSAGAKREKMDWRELQPAAQAGIRCDDPIFWKFLDEEYRMHTENSNDAAFGVRSICDVVSRSDLGTNHKARVLWHKLDEHFQAWKLIDA